MPTLGIGNLIFLFLILFFIFLVSDSGKRKIGQTLNAIFYSCVYLIFSKFGKSLKIGDRVKLSGGYSRAGWIKDRDFILGKVVNFIPGQNSEKAAVVLLDEKIKDLDEKMEGDVAVLSLRYVGARWESYEIVHVELCNFIPEPKMWKDRKQGLWIESHATYKRI